MISAMRTRSSSEVSRSDERRHCLTAASRPTRENTNVIAGNSPSRSGVPMTSGRPGGAYVGGRAAALGRLPVGQPVGLGSVCDVAQQIGVDEKLPAGLRRPRGAVVEQV